MVPDPLITLIIVAGNFRDRVQRSLRSVLSQDIADRIAIIVYDRADEPRRDISELNNPNVIYEAVANNTTLGQLAKRGLLAATTDIVAFVDEHVAVPAGWARESLRLHAQGYAGVCGYFVPGNPQHRCARLALFVTKGNYILPQQAGETTAMSGDNSSFVRSKILNGADDLEAHLNSDPLLIRRLVDAGEKCYRTDLAVKHWNEDRWSDAWAGFRFWTQMYICNKAAIEKWSPAQRLLRLLLVPLVPIVRTYKNYKLARVNSMDMKQFFLDVPSLFFLHSGTAAGMAGGLLFGLQDSGVRFADYEINASRSD